MRANKLCCYAIKMVAVNQNNHIKKYSRIWHDWKGKENGWETTLKEEILAERKFGGFGGFV